MVHVPPVYNGFFNHGYDLYNLPFTFFIVGEEHPDSTKCVFFLYGDTSECTIMHIAKPFTKEAILNSQPFLKSVSLTQVPLP